MMREGGVPLLVTTIPIAIGIAIYYLVQNRQEQQQNHKTSIPRQLKGSLYENELKIAIGLALQTGHNIKEALNKYKSIDKKGDGEIDFVTATDKENERIIFTELQKHFPTHKFIGEESSAESNSIPELTSEPTWIVDPVDGTTNFVHSFPFVCVSISLVIGKIPILGVVFDPSADELFLAIKGRGAYLNQRRISVSSVEKIKEAMILTEFGYEREDKSVQRVLNGLQEVIRRGPHAIRIMGSGVLDLCYVACGRLDACYCGLAGEGWKPWDYAAAGLLLTEAGGSMSKLNGEPFDLYGSNMIAASTLSLRKDIQDALNYY